MLCFTFFNELNLVFKFEPNTWHIQSLQSVKLTC
jgi:hypothetical protein